MENMPPMGRRIIKVSRIKLIWTIAAIVVLTLGYFFIINSSLSTARLRGGYNTSNIEIPAIESPSYSGNYEDSYAPDYYPYNNNESSTKDTREFLKVSYSADLKTRDVYSVIRNVKSAIKVADGRIDGINESTKYGRVNFVIPKTNFETFKDEIQSLTNEKLYTETINSQNLLNQKQSIEEQRNSADSSLAQLRAKQKAQTARHNQALGSLQASLASVQGQLSVVRAEITTEKDPATLNELKKTEAQLVQEESSLRQNIAYENSNYVSLNQDIQSQINATTGVLANVEKQDEKFTDNVETVNGYVTISWISWWDLIKIFSPIHPTILIIILIIILCLLLRHKSFVPKVEFV